MNIFYEQPTDYNESKYGIRTDINGKTIWINWSAWISSIEINSQETLKLLPPEIYKYVNKWESKILKKKKEKYSLDYPIKLASIYFIYNDNVYKITPSAFKNTKIKRPLGTVAIDEYFEGVHEIIEKDLIDAGCIFTFYNDFLD